MRKPELNDERPGDQLGGERDRPAEPVVPAHRKTERRIDEAFCIRLERPRNGQLRGHFAKRLHHAVDRKTHGGVREQRAAGPGLRYRAATGEKQARADRAADRDHAELPGTDTALQFARFTRNHADWFGDAHFILGQGARRAAGALFKVEAIVAVRHT